MENIREQLNRPVVVGVVAFILGLFIGLVVLGWGLWPVKWTDASPQQLRDDLKVDYLRMAVQSYQVNPDPAIAKQRFDELGDEKDEVLQQLQADPGNLTPQAITSFATVVSAAAPPVAQTPVAGTPPAEATEEGGGSNLTRTVLPLMCLITLVLAGLLFAIYMLRSRKAQGGSVATPVSTDITPETKEADWTSYATTGEEPPMAQFMASYKLGDDLFDDSFSIDSPSGEFLGECGVGISEPIGVGDPKKVTAFEVWLFDKNDIQTVTKLLMSSHAYTDDTIRQRLAAKGEPVLAAPGTQVVLETATLQLVARVVDMAYGDGALPPESFFDNLILELAVWPK